MLCRPPRPGVHAGGLGGLAHDVTAALGPDVTPPSTPQTQRNDAITKHTATSPAPRFHAHLHVPAWDLARKGLGEDWRFPREFWRQEWTLGNGG